jgi:hypothetical protein
MAKVPPGIQIMPLPAVEDFGETTECFMVLVPG